MKSNPKPYDVIIVGLGAMGAAALYQLALAGKRVLGIDQFAPPHTLGSSHGETRITRQAIGEGSAYVPFALRSHEIWREIESKTGKILLFQVGGLILGDPGCSTIQHGKGGFIENTIATAKQFSIPHEIYDAAALRQRFPQFNVSDSEIGYYELGAGYVRPEECINAQLALAKELGATVVTNCKVTAIDADSTSDGATVKTHADTYRSEQVIVAAGPWIESFFTTKPQYFKVYRQVLFWFSPKGPIAPFQSDRCPIFIWTFNHSGGDGMYGFPAIDGPNGGVKLASEQYVVTESPDTVNREVTQDEIDYTYTNYVKDRFPLLSSNCVKVVSCMYTNTPDSDFVIQRHPDHEQIIIASPCSGHGFKHSAAIGETLAQLAVRNTTEIDISKFVVKSAF